MARAGHSSQVRRGARKGFVEDKGLAKKKNDSAPRSKIYFFFEKIELPAKLLDYLLWSNKSNIHQSLPLAKLVYLFYSFMGNPT